MPQNQRSTARRPRAAASFLALVAAGCLTPGCGGENVPMPRGIRHVLLISLDTTRADHLGCYGSSRHLTPNLDALAAESVRFDQVMAPAPTTLASHTSMMTGLYPRRHGVPRNGFVIDEANEMLAELMARTGFHTAAFLGSFALERHFDFQQGFDYFDQEFDVMFSLESGTDQNQRLAENVTQAVLDHVDEVKDSEERLFLFAHYFDPHAPFAPPESFAKQHARQGAPLVSIGRDLEQATKDQQRALIGEAPGHGSVLRSGLRRDLLDKVPSGPFGKSQDMADLYAAEVAYMDRELGRLFDGLRERGLMDETLVIVTGDHGETFWDHGDFWNHGLWLFQSTVRIPWIMRIPERLEGERPAALVIDEPVSTVDLVPTLCELLLLEPPAMLDGQSLVPAIDGQTLQRGPIFTEATQPWANHVERDELGWPGDLKPRAVRDGRWKYIHAPYVARRAGGYEQLFDLRNDPLERTNLLQSGGASSKVIEVRARLRQALDGYAALPLPRKIEKTSAQNKEVAQRLQALGYTGDK